MSEQGLDLRVSDEERSHVVDILQKATGRGLLDIEEFATRTDTALAARTRSELNAVVVDLPGLVNTAAPASFGQQVAGPQSSTLTGFMTGIQRNGPWAVPSELSISNVLSPTKLDFRRAKFSSSRIDIKLEVTLGAVKLWLPEGATVNADQLNLALGSIKGPSTEAPGNPHFVISGQMMLSSLKVYRTGHGWWHC